MRYIIIPLIIFLYLYWSYKSIKELIRVEWKLSAIRDKEYPIVYVFLHIMCIILILGLLSIKFCIDNW